LQGFLLRMLEVGVDTVVLGCTHYLFVEPLIRDIVGPQVAIVESSVAVVRELERRLGSNRNTGIGQSMFYSSLACAQTDRLFQSLLGGVIQVQALPI
jgi:glutamate racemase